MKEYTDYQSSSTSTYQAGSFCVEEQNKKSIQYKFDNNGISQKRDPDTKLISLTIVGKKMLSDPKIFTVGNIIQKLKQKRKVYQGDELVISFGAGSGTTEMSSEVLCLCIDSDRRSVFTGLSQVKEQATSNLTVFAVMDFSKNMKQLLTEVKTAFPDLILRVLVQHPSPSPDALNQSNLKQLFSCLQKTMESGIVFDTTFIYDYDVSRDRNTWSRQSILAIFNSTLDFLNSNNYSVAEEKLISSQGENVKHPLFGRTSRYGWTSMRKSDEYSFSIRFKNNNSHKQIKIKKV